MEQEKEQEAPKKRGRGKKFFLVLLVLAILGAVVYFYRDKPCKPIQTTDFNAEVDGAAGEIVDYHFAYDALQAEDVGEVEENGWRLILQAFGPRALGQENLVSQISWEEFPTNVDWFANYWTPLCEKFKLDPNVRPTMLDRPDVWSYVAENGLTGDEPEPEVFESDCDGDSELENVAPAKVDSLNVYVALTGKPWSKEEYPKAAQWFDENADYFDVLSRAARSPRCVCWKIIKNPSEGGFIGDSSPELLFIKEATRQLVARANYRLGSGDVSGAIDDVETMTLFARALLESKSGFIFDRLTGTSTLSMASGVQLFNASVSPTDAELARVAALWRDFYDADFFTQAIERAAASEKIISLGSFQDLLAMRRNGSLPLTLSDEPLGESEGLVKWLLRKATERALLKAAPVDDAKAFAKFRDLLERADVDPAVREEVDAHSRTLTWLKSSPEKNLAYYGLRATSYADQLTRDACRRLDCVMREKAIVCAFWAYQREHGTLPPAFTVDSEGKPLQSWRVLILPYLGEEEKALYDEIALDEPWDSEHNREFFARVPKAYRCPEQEARQAEGEAQSVDAHYSVLIGVDGFFDESGVGKDLSAALEAKGGDAARQPILVERGEPVCWMKPDAELRIDDYATGQADGVGRFFQDRRHSEGMNYATPSGAVLFLSESTDVGEFNVLLRGLPAPQKNVFEDFDESTSDEASAEETSELVE